MARRSVNGSSIRGDSPGADAGDQPVMARHAPLRPRSGRVARRPPLVDRYAQHTRPSTPAAEQRSPTRCGSSTSRILRLKADTRLLATTRRACFDHLAGRLEAKAEAADPGYSVLLENVHRITLAPRCADDLFFGRSLFGYNGNNSECASQSIGFHVERSSLVRA